MMTLQPEHFWSFSEWLLRPDAFLESALLQGIVLFGVAVLLGLLIGYLVAAVRNGPGEGFFSVARVLRDFLARDLPGMSSRRTFAIAKLAFKEAMRRRVLIVVGLFLVGLLLAGWYLDPRSEDPARLYISFVLTATNYLVLFLALFISTFSIPADIKSRTIYTVVTKPVRPTEMIFGKILGFAAVGTLVIIPMAIASYFFVRRDLAHDHAVVEAQELPDGRLEGLTSFDRNHRHSFLIEADGTGVTDKQRGHRHVVRKEGDQFVVGQPVGMLQARVPVYGTLQFLDRRGRETEEGINVGDEEVRGGYSSGGIARMIGQVQTPRKHQHAYVEGGTLSAAIYTFYDVRPDRFTDGEEGLPIEVILRVYRSHKGDIESGVRGSITLRNPDRPTIESVPVPFVVQESQVDEHFIPREIEGTVGSDSAQLDVYQDLVSEDGRLEVIIRSLDRGQYLGMTQSDVYLKAADRSFALNLFKGFTSIWLQMLVITSLGVMFSTFLTGSVAMVATLVCLVLGFTAESVFELSVLQAATETSGGGPIESIVRIVRQDSMTTDLDVETTAYTIIKYSDWVILKALDATATALPNLPKMDTSEFVASGFDVFGGLLARHIATTIAYVLITAFIGYFFLKTREVAA